MKLLKEVILLLIANDEPLEPEWFMRSLATGPITESVT